MPAVGKLDAKVAIVTGSTSGIGRASALLFAEEGAQVVIVGRDKTRGSDTQREIESRGGEAHFIRADVTNEENVKSLMEETISKFGKLDILVNNVGGLRLATIQEMSLADWNFVLNANLTSTFLCSKYGIPHLAKSGKGVVLNMSSPAAFNPLALRGAYCSARAGIIMFTRVLATENYGKHIRANCIVPGFVLGKESTFRVALQQLDNADRIMEGFLGGHPNPGNCKAEDVAKLALYLVSDDSYYVNGASFVMDGGMSSLTEYARYENDLKDLATSLKKKSAV